MFDSINSILELNKISVKVNNEWVMLKKLLPIKDSNSFPIEVENELGNIIKCDMADIEKFEECWLDFLDTPEYIRGIS